MASVNLAAASLAVVLLLCAAMTATAYQPKPTPTPKPYPTPKPEAEDCKRQAEYFKNCLRLGLGEKCCGNERVIPVAERKCYCQVEREAEIECAIGRRCGGIAGKVKVAEMKLSCLENLHCKRA
ncbi:uncharacterized protein LOC124683845 [Lolium rigidum]|uniref:uncharacterized protein LOC124683845 n=1 Tax=Lolium rigidum TaxID=89674 RepID=UPI001F5E12F9|nr:uncharacterized protein LOC124683845 [Lolium rigidum]